jgi:hypothetical protein
MPSKQVDIILLAHLITQELLYSPVPVRLASTKKDETPRVVPRWFHWNGEQNVLGSPAHSAEGDDPSRPPTSCTDD